MIENLTNFIKKKIFFKAYLKDCYLLFLVKYCRCCLSYWTISLQQVNSLSLWIDLLMSFRSIFAVLSSYDVRLLPTHFWSSLFLCSKSLSRWYSNSNLDLYRYVVPLFCLVRIQDWCTPLLVIIFSGASFSSSTKWPFLVGIILIISASLASNLASRKTEMRLQWWTLSQAFSKLMKYANGLV